MTNSKTFTDTYGDRLVVENFGGSSKDGVISMKQAGKSLVFGVQKKDRLPLAEALLSPLDAVVVEGLPETEEYTYGGVTKVRAKVSGLMAEISQAELDYFLKTGKERLAIANGITKALADKEAKAEEERQERLAAAEKRKARRDELAREFTALPWMHYSGVNGATKSAIDRIIELEDAAK